MKLQSIRKTKTCRNACKKTFNDPKIRRSTAVLLYTVGNPTPDIGKSILEEKGEIRSCSKVGVEFLDVDKEVTRSSAKKQCSRKWHNKPLKQSYIKYNCDFSETESSNITKFKDQNFEPIEVFKDCFSEDIMNYTVYADKSLNMSYKVVTFSLLCL